MKIGYPCKNISLDAGAKTFRLASYSDERQRQTIAGNLESLERMLAYNVEMGLLHFRVSSNIIPFASHPVCTLDWKNEFANTFKSIGKFAKEHAIRLTVHPGQFVLINSLSPSVVGQSVKELEYQADLLDLLGTGSEGKIQIHVGGVYGDKPAAMARFVESWRNLPENIKNRLAIENDERLFSLADCLAIHQQIAIPIIFDTFHHSIFNDGEDLREAVTSSATTWGGPHGTLMIDYSSQAESKQLGAHTDHIVGEDFKNFLIETKGVDADVMLEIKDKEKSALEALCIAKEIGIL